MIFNKNVLMINSDTNVAKPLHGVNGFIYSVFAIFYGCICFYITQKSSSYAQVDLTTFKSILIVSILLWIFAIILGQNGKMPSKTWIITTSCVFQLILLPAFPVLENDIFRYLWDGFVFAE